jgi:hypothetical protein
MHAGIIHNKWFLDEYFGLDSETTTNATGKFAELKGAFIDSPGILLKEGFVSKLAETGDEYYADRGYSIAILCVCKTNPKMIVSEPLALFDYTLMYARFADRATVSVRVDETYAGEPSDWLKLDYDGERPGNYKRLTDAVAWK